MRKIASITRVIPVVFLLLASSFIGEAQRGYVEGRSLKLEWRFAEERDERLSLLAGEGRRDRAVITMTDGEQQPGGLRHFVIWLVASCSRRLA